jgi:AraC-like DNA-binding protein
MKYVETEPHELLREHVKCFWILEHTYTPPDPGQEVLPDACVEFIFNFGAPYRLATDGTAEQAMPRAFLVGFLTQPLMFRCDGTVRVVAIRFHAWGVRPFLHASAEQPRNVSVALDQAWSSVVSSIEPRVGSGDYDRAVELVQEHLIGRLLEATCDQREIRAAAQLLARERGAVRIAELAERCFVSVRQLQRQFQEATGVSPKTLARSMRFDAAREKLMFAPDTNLTGLALDCGYSDQAHFIRDFREFAHKTPGEFAAEMKAMQVIFRDRANVLFLQSPGA